MKSIFIIGLLFLSACGSSGKNTVDPSVTQSNIVYPNPVGHFKALDPHAFFTTLDFDGNSTMSSTMIIYGAFCEVFQNFSYKIGSGNSISFYNQGQACKTGSCQSCKPTGPDPTGDISASSYTYVGSDLWIMGFHYSKQ